MRSALHKKFLPPFQGGAAPDPLLIGLESYWALDELSGTRFDSVGSNDLTDNNTVGYINDGPRGVCANFTSANSEYLSCAAPPVNPSTDDYTYAGWTRVVEDGTYLFTMVNGHYLYYLTGFGGVLLLKDALGAQVSTTEGNIADGRWIFWAATFNHLTGAATLRCYGGDSVGASSAGVLNADDASGAQFRIAISVTGGDYANQREANVGVWNRILTLPEVVALYNAGRGKRYSDLGPAEKVNLVSYWNLDEVGVETGAVTRVDSHGANNLTDNNSVTSVNTGPEQVVANFVAASSEYLSSGANPPLSLGATGTVAVWSKYHANGAVLGKDNAPGGIREWGLHWGGSQDVMVEIFNTIGGYISPTIGFLPTDDRWHLIIAWFDAGISTGYIQVDNMTPVSAVLAGTPVLTANPFLIGQNNWSYSDKPEALVGFWSRTLTPAERTELFNSGVGKKYSELSAGIKTNLVSYWNLTELSGNRADSHGANTLTDNNTVMSVINMNDVADKVCAKFIKANTEYLSNALVTIPATNGFTFVAWVKAGTPDVWAGWIELAGNILFGYNIGRVYSYVDGGVQTAQNPYIADGNWHLSIGWVDYAAKKIYHQVDDNTPDEVAYVAAVYPAPTTSFKIGLWGVAYWDGLIDEVMAYSRVLTPTERTRLFNLGKGVFYPTFT